MYLYICYRIPNEIIHTYFRLVFKLNFLCVSGAVQLDVLEATLTNTSLTTSLPLENQKGSSIGK